jgi:hypothetical protein
MVECKREIDKDIYDRACKTPSHYIADEDYDKLFDVSLINGYGVYGARAIEENGKYYCIFRRGESCD